MKQKLLNFSKNLIKIGLVVIAIMLFFTTSSYAAEPITFGGVMREHISTWYRVIFRLSLSVYVVGYFVIILKLLADRTPEKMRKLKESVGYFLIVLGLLIFLTYIMIAILYLNSQGIEMSKKIGESMSGINMDARHTELGSDEYDLYRTALSKAYELEMIPGFLGLVMYLLLVYYTFKLTIIYLKRYFNIIVLILISPIVFVTSGLKKIVTGVRDNGITKWFKEFIYNVILQTIHAIYYSVFIGYVFKFVAEDETLVWGFLILILFGFIFKIDGLIRKLFNFVGGSTKISKSKMVGSTINNVGGAINTGLDAMGSGIESGATKFGENIGDKGFKEGFKQSGKDFGDFLHKKGDDFKGGFKEMPSKLKEKAILTGYNIEAKREATKEKVASAFAEAKAEVKDYKNILGGNRVEANLTKEEIIAAAHAMKEGRGLEGLRQNLGLIGHAAIKGVKRFDKKAKELYKKGNKRVKTAISEVEKEMEKDIDRLDNSVETAKRMGKYVSNLRKRNKSKKSVRRTLRSAQDAVAMVVDLDDVDIEELTNQLKEEYGNDIDITAYAFENIGAQTLLVPELGSSRMGMAVLAEEKYEEKAYDKLDEIEAEEAGEAIEQEERILRAPSRINKGTTKKELARDVKKAIKETGFSRKTYKFSRFSRKAARKITNRMLDKTVKGNKHLLLIRNTSDKINSQMLTARGTVSGDNFEVEHEIKLSRKDAITSVRDLKLKQQQAVTKQKELVKQTRRVEMANNVAGQVMEARNTIKLEFMQVDKLSHSQAAVRMMMEQGRLQELPSGLVAITQNAKPQVEMSLENKLVATGLESKQNPQNVIQFVVNEQGKIIPQIVTKEGKITNPVAVTKAKAEVQQQEAMSQFVAQTLGQYGMQIANGEKPELKRREDESEQEFAMRKQVVAAFNQYMQKEPEQAQSMLKQLTTAQTVKEVTKQTPLMQPGFVKNLKSEEQVQVMQKFTEVLTPFMQKTEVGNPMMSLQNLQAEEKATVLQNVFAAFNEYAPENAKIEPKLLVQNMDKETQNQTMQGVVNILSEYVQKTEDGTPKLMLDKLEPAQREQVVQNVLNVFTTARENIVQTQTKAQVVATPMMQFATLLQTAKPESTNQITTGFTEVLNQYIKPTQIGEPMMSLQNMPVEEKAVVLQNVLQVFNQVVPEKSRIDTASVVANMKPEAQNQAMQGMVSLLSQYVQKTEDGTPRIVLDNLKQEEKGQVVQSLFEVFTKATISPVSEPITQTPQEPIQFTTILGKAKPQEQAHIIQNFSEIVNQYVKPTEVGNPVVAIANMPQEEKAVMLQNVANVMSQYVPALKQQNATAIIENMQPEAQNQVVQGLVEIFSEHKEIAEEGSLALKLAPDERKQIVQEIAEVFTENVQPKQETKPEAETKEAQEQKEQAVQSIVKALEQYIASSEENIDVSEFVPQTSTEKLEVMENIVQNIAPTDEGKIVQQIVTLEGDIIEQTINPDDNTIETESYKYIGKGDEGILKQIQETVQNSDLGLPPDATIEERTTAFDNLVDDLRREANTESLLDQIITEANVAAEEHKEEDKVLLSAMEEANITTVADLKKAMYFEQDESETKFMTPDDKEKEQLRQSKEVLDKVIENKTVTTPIADMSDVEDDILGDALDKLNETANGEINVDKDAVYDRVEGLDPSDADSLLETAAEMERIRIAEELMNNGGYTVDNPPTDSDIDATVESKMDSLSDLLFGLAKESIEQATEYPREIIEETVESINDIVQETKKEDAEKEFRKEYEKAEKKWAKEHGQEADNSVIDEYVLGKKDDKKKGKGDQEDEDATIKITLRFYGAVRNQGQSITLSNRYSMKDFYDRVDKLDEASYVKTEERFMQNYGSKLKELQLGNFSFAKNPVEKMDGWSIYVVSEKEDIEPEEHKKDEVEAVEEDVFEIIKKYSFGLRQLFKQYVEDYEITSFDEIYNVPSNKRELVTRVRMFLFRRNESNENDKAIRIVEKLYKVIEFKNILREANRDRIAKSDSEEAVKKAKEKVKITSKEKAESDAGKEYTEEEVASYKNKKKATLMDQILGSIKQKQETEAIEPEVATEETASIEVQNLLNQMTEGLYADLGIKKENLNNKKLQY